MADVDPLLLEAASNSSHLRDRAPFRYVVGVGLSYALISFFVFLLVFGWPIAIWIVEQGWDKGKWAIATMSMLFIQVAFPFTTAIVLVLNLGLRPMVMVSDGRVVTSSVILGFCSLAEIRWREGTWKEALKKRKWTTLFFSRRRVIYLILPLSSLSPKHVEQAEYLVPIGCSSSSLRIWKAFLTIARIPEVTKHLPFNEKSQ